MDHKSWLWKRRSTEKTLIADKANHSTSINEVEATEVQDLPTEKIEFEKKLTMLNEKLLFSMSECNAKDNIAKKQMKIAQEAIAGWEKAETELVSLKKELDKVLLQKAASEERLGQLDAALKECMQQLRFVREEQEKRVQDAVMKTSEEFEKTQIALDEKLAEAGKLLAKLKVENNQLSSALLVKDKAVEDLTRYRANLETDFTALMLRIESTEKENASLKYELRVLEKELDIRNEEREFNRRTTDTTQKQHQEYVKKIAKLESECQRLRLLVRKRLPGPAALAKMKNEVELLGKDQVERRRKSNPSMISSMDFHVDVVPDTPSMRINILTEQLQIIEEENKSLRNALNKKSSELQLSRTMYASAASKLSRFVGHVEGTIKDQTTRESGTQQPYLQETSQAVLSDTASDDKASCAESWASALILELEHFKNEKQICMPSHRNIGMSDMNLMDDFAEMEAVVSVDYPAGSSRHSSDEGTAFIGPSETPGGGHTSTIAAREMMPNYDCPSEPSDSWQKSQPDHNKAYTVPGKLGSMLKMLLQQSKESQRNAHEVLEDLKVALAHNSLYTTDFNSKGIIHDLDTLYSPDVSGHVLQTPPNRTLKSSASDVRNHNIATGKASSQKFGSNVSISIQKIIEILEGINITSQDSGVPESRSGNDNKLLSYKNPEAPTGYMVRLFQWKTAEIFAILENFVQTCNNLLNGTADLEQFVQQVACNLDWVINHCFSLQDVSSMKDAIRNHLEWDESRSESEVDSGNNSSYPMEAFQLNMNEESKKFYNQLINKESSNVELADRFLSDTVKGESTRTELQENITENSQLKMENMNQSIGSRADQVEKQKMIKEDLETQLININLEWKKACEKILHLENELDYKNNSCKRLEKSCNDLKRQLERMASKELQNSGKHLEMQHDDDWEIAAASEKLAECQETILNLGKQLKALASPRHSDIFDKVNLIPADTVAANVPTSQRYVSQRSSLLDRMLAEDSNQFDASSRTKDDTLSQNGNASVSTNTAIESWSKLNNQIGDTHDESMAIVPGKKTGGRSLWKKLISRHKKSKSKR